MKAKVFYGTSDELQKELNEWLENNTVQIRQAVQSQSTKYNETCVTLTVLYTEG